MVFKSIALAATTLVLSTSVNAALITNLSNVNINGTNYDVTFHTGAGDSFNALWDADDDGVFGGGASVFASGPTFWGDGPGAFAAATAIAGALGTVNTTSASFDSFAVPYSVNPTGPITAGNDRINEYADGFGDPASTLIAAGSIFDDAILTNMPWTSFAVSAVPVPAAVWLFGSGLLGLIGVARRKVHV